MVTFFRGLSVFQRLAPHGGWALASSKLQWDSDWMWLVLWVGIIWNQASDNDGELAVKCLQVVREQNLDLCWNSSLLPLHSPVPLCVVLEDAGYSLYCFDSDFLSHSGTTFKEQVFVPNCWTFLFHPVMLLLLVSNTFGQDVFWKIWGVPLIVNCFFTYFSLCRALVTQFLLHSAPSKIHTLLSICYSCASNQN